MGFWEEGMSHLQRKWLGPTVPQNLCGWQYLSVALSCPWSSDPTCHATKPSPHLVHCPLGSPRGTSGRPLEETASLLLKKIGT